MSDSDGRYRVAVVQVPLFVNVIRPKRTPSVLLIRLMRVRFAMSIFGSAFLADAKQIVTRKPGRYGTLDFRF